MENIKFKTSDGVELAGLLWDRKAPVSVILMHMMPAKKESWSPFGEELAESSGYNVLAFDFRGHGESEGGNWEDFSSEQHQKYYLDLEAAVSYLKERFPDTGIYLGGASIGANIAIKYMAEHPEVSKVLALSAGLDYHGVSAEEYVKQTDSGQDLLLVAASDDMGKSGTGAGRQTEILYDLANCQKEKVIFQTGGHGTNILTAHPDLADTIQDFFAS